MIIRKWSGSAWVAQSPKITYTDIVNDVTSVDGNGDPNFVSIFNNGKLRESYLPNSVLSGMKFVGSITGTGLDLEDLITGATGVSGSLDDLTSLNGNSDYASNNEYQKYIGHYWVVTRTDGASLRETQEGQYRDAGGYDDGSGPDNSQGGNDDIHFEQGDWVIITGWDSTNDYFLFSGINNTYRLASGTEAGIMTASDFTKLSGIETGADVTDATNVTSSLVSATGITNSDKSTIRSNLGVDAAGTDNSTDVSLAGSLDYLTISGQTITRNAIDLTTDVSGALPIANGGTGATSASAARTALGVDAAGTDNSTDVTLAGSYDYLTISGQTITLGQVDYNTDISNTPTIGNGTLTVSEGVGLDVTTTGGNFTANDTGNTTITVKMEQPFIVSASAPASAYEVSNNLWFDI